MEKTIKSQRLPKTDSIEELARFWDTHDLTDFEQDLEEVPEPVFVRARAKSISIELQPTEAEHLKKIARSKGVKETTVVRQWILQGLHQSSYTGRPHNKAMQPSAQRARRG
ncbi:MAG: CopG family antitoxin [Acidobacteriota bacterium]